MPFTAQELSNIASSLIDYHERGPAIAQTLQDRPLYDAMQKKEKFFPGGKENITVPVKGAYTTTMQGYSHDDTVQYQNPANTKRAAYPWKEQHGGINCTLTELKAEGISVVDSQDSASTTEHSERELIVLTGLLSEKIDDMNEGIARDFNSMLWLDGSQDVKDVPGITSIITDNPSIGTVGGLSGATLNWWRNRARTLQYASGKGFAGAAGDGRITSDVANGGALITFLQDEYRQLRRYGGNPNLWLAGSDFIGALEKELRANGQYTEMGFNMSKNTEVGMADITFKGNKIIYDPTLDDMNYEKRLYVIDQKHIVLRPMEGEKWKQHTPTRPAQQYVLYRAKTWTGGLTCSKRNSSGVYEIK